MQRSLERERELIARLLMREAFNLMGKTLYHPEILLADLARRVRQRKGGSNGDGPKRRGKGR